MHGLRIEVDKTSMVKYVNCIHLGLQFLQWVEPKSHGHLGCFAGKFAPPPGILGSRKLRRLMTEGKFAAHVGFDCSPVSP